MPNHVRVILLCERIYTDIWAVRRCASFFIVLPHFVEVVFIQLPHEARKIAVFEMLGKDGFCEFLVLRWSKVNMMLNECDADKNLPPRAPRSYLLHHPISRLTHMKDLPTFYANISVLSIIAQIRIFRFISWRCRLLVQFAHL